MMPRYLDFTAISVRSVQITIPSPTHAEHFAVSLINAFSNDGIQISCTPIFFLYKNGKKKHIFLRFP